MTHSKSVVVIAASLVLFATASPVEHVANRVEKKRTTCYNAPYVIYAAGTQPDATNLSPPYPTYSDSIMPAIASSAIPGAVATALPYPAAGIADPSQYYPSWFEGTQALQETVMDYVDSCSGQNPQVVLMGYSQGASIVTSAIGGFYLSCSGCTQIDPLASKYTDAIVGGAIFADTSFVPGLSPLDYASSEDPNTSAYGSFQNGNAVSTANTVLGKVIRSFCEAGDEYCANAGPSGGSIHGSSESYWEPAAVTFLQSLKLS